MAAAVETKEDLSAAKPRLLFAFRPPLPRLEGTYRRPYDVTSDGEHFLLVEGGDDPAAHRIHAVLNWLEDR